MHTSFRPTSPDHSRLRLLTLGILMLLLGGCGSPSMQSTQSQLPEPGTVPTLSEIELLLAEAEESEPLVKAEYTLQAAEGLFAEAQVERAEDLLNRINPMMLSEARLQYYWLLKAQIASTKQQPQQSLEWLARITQPGLLPANQQQRWLDLESNNLSQLGDSVGVIAGLIEQSNNLIAALESDDAQADYRQSERPIITQLQQLHDRIWQLLRQLPPEQRQRQSEAADAFQISGWYALAQAASDSQLDLLALSQRINRWQSQWASHPAAVYLPSQLRLLTAQYSDTPQHIAVLLPQSGALEKPAKAILEGMLAAHYQDQQLGYQAPRISFYDSTVHTDLDFFYHFAEYEGIDFIIGPLAKARVNALYSQGKLLIPTLALNYAELGNAPASDTAHDWAEEPPEDNPWSAHSITEVNATLEQGFARDHANLYQFGLRGEDEARQVAQRAWREGHRKAVSLTPTTGWGQRIAAAFADAWQQLGGQLVAQQSFTGNNDFSEKISQLLAVDASDERRKALRALTGEAIEFESRRRQDVDFIFLSALSQAGRQIKPTLAFYYASDLPVYATSHIYSGEPAKTRDQDLNGISFTSMPWTLEQQNPLKSSLSFYRKDTNSRFGRLYALGADAYRIAPYVQQLQQAGNAHIQGQTGRLEVTDTGLVKRSLDWGQFRNGLAEKQPGPDSEASSDKTRAQDDRP